MGIRTPDLLHAIRLQHIHPHPFPQVTVLACVPRCASVRAGCGTSVLYRSATAADLSASSAGNAQVSVMSQCTTITTRPSGSQPKRLRQPFNIRALTCRPSATGSLAPETAGSTTCSSWPGSSNCARAPKAAAIAGAKPPRGRPTWKRCATCGGACPVVYRQLAADAKTQAVKWAGTGVHLQRRARGAGVERNPFTCRLAG